MTSKKVLALLINETQAVILSFPMEEQMAEIVFAKAVQFRQLRREDRPQVQTFGDLIILTLLAERYPCAPGDIAYIKKMPAGTFFEIP